MLELSTSKNGEEKRAQIEGRRIHRGAAEPMPAIKHQKNEFKEVEILSLDTFTDDEIKPLASTNAANYSVATYKQKNTNVAIKFCTKMNATIQFKQHFKQYKKPLLHISSASRQWFFLIIAQNVTATRYKLCDQIA